MKERNASRFALGPEELSVFCYQLSLMVKAGISSEESLGILADDAAGPRERELLNAYHARVRQAIAPHLSPEEARWLDQATRPV